MLKKITECQGCKARREKAKKFANMAKLRMQEFYKNNKAKDVLNNKGGEN